MAEKVLIAYASKHGSTAQIAIEGWAGYSADVLNGTQGEPDAAEEVSGPDSSETGVSEKE